MKKRGFIGAKMKYGNTDYKQWDEDHEDKYGKTDHSTEWKNMRPICPYGCGEEGSLLEIVVKDGKALGIYTHSESIKPFTAELQMSPKPSAHKIIIGPDGEPMVQK